MKIPKLVTITPDTITIDGEEFDLPVMPTDDVLHVEARLLVTADGLPNAMVNVVHLPIYAARVELSDVSTKAAREDAKSRPGG